MYTRLITDINNFLRPHYITVTISDIFEDTLLKMAGADQQAQKAHMDAITDDIMKFEFIGLNAESAEKFRSLLSDLDDEVSCVENDGIYEFITNVDGIYNDLLPKFKEEVAKLKENNPEKYQNYQKECENDNSIQEYKLFEGIENELDQIVPSELTENAQGEFHVIHENLKEMVKLHQDHYSHNCGAFDKLLDACNLFVKHSQDNESLRNNEIIKRTNAKLKEFLQLTVAREQLAKLTSALRSLFGGELALSMSSGSKSETNPTFGSFMNLFRSSPDSSSSSSSSSDSEMDFEMEEEISTPNASPRLG